jgi:hypothetical protein
LKLSEDDGPPVADATFYRSLTNALQYLTFSRSDIAYDVQQVCLHMHTLREPHLTALKRILRYLRGSLDCGLVLRPSPMSELWSTSTLIGLAFPTRAGLLPVMSCSWTTTSSPGLPSGSLLSLAPTRRLSVALWPTVWKGLLAAPASPGAPQLPSARHPRLLRQRQRSLPLHQSRVALAHFTWRSTRTLSVSVSLSTTFGFSPSPPRCSFPTSS